MMMWLAEIIEPEPKKALVRSAWWLWVALTTLGVLLVVMTGMVLAARRARRMASANKPRRRRGRPIPDAWAEAGRRVMPIRMDEPPPDVMEEPAPPEDRP
jgi:hypothetical protein